MMHAWRGGDHLLERTGYPCKHFKIKGDMTDPNFIIRIASISAFTDGDRWAQKRLARAEGCLSGKNLWTVAFKR